MNAKSTPGKTTQVPAIQKRGLVSADNIEVEFVPFGVTDKIKISAAMVQSFIAIPTKSGKMPTARDCVKFLMLCKGKRANPFEGDCFMIGYDNADGTATFSIVCGVELFLKRAESNENYKGCDYGIIVSGGDTGTIERHGGMLLKNETLLGGWAKVYRKDRDFPFYKSVNFETFNSGYSRWKKDPTGMIAKVALSQALREAFPTAIGGLYTQEEMQRVTEMGEGTVTLREPIPMPEEIPQGKIEQKPEDDSQDPPRIEDSEVPFK